VANGLPYSVLVPRQQQRMELDLKIYQGMHAQIHHEAVSGGLYDK
jgi:hypothetical protein